MKKGAENKPLVMLSANTAWNVHSRSRLLAAIREAGWDVITLAADDEYSTRITGELGIPFIPLPMKGDGTNLREDAALFLRFLGLYRSHRPQCAIHLNNKPNIYGTLAASLLGIPSISNVTGLGIVAEKSALVKAAVYSLYRLAFGSKRSFVFFQNADDRSFFVDRKIVRPGRTGLLPGSGVDVSRFSPAVDSTKPARGHCRFLFSGRLLISKGILDFLEAAKRVKTLYPATEFTIIGEHDTGNPIYAPEPVLAEAITRRIVDYKGMVADVRPIVGESDCVVLPSRYREGVPRALLEAAAMGKPLIVADSIGTREPVEHGHNGYLVSPGDAEGLAEAMLRFIGLTHEEKMSMGTNSRRIAVERFSDSSVIDRYIARLAQTTSTRK